MTREEIIRNLKYTMEKHKNDTVKTFDTNISAMCKDILDYLEQEPCDVFDEYGNYKYPSDVELTEPNAATSMPCEDAINRKATLKPYKDLNDEDTISVWLIRKNIEQQPPVNPQPKTGHWIFDEILDKHYYCSECKSMGVDYWDFCPNCGSYNGGD